MRTADLLAPGISTIHLPLLLEIACVPMHWPHCYSHLPPGSVLCSRETQRVRGRSHFRWKAGLRSRGKYPMHDRLKESKALDLIHTHPIPDWVLPVKEITFSQCLSASKLMTPGGRAVLLNIILSAHQLGQS